MPTEQPLDRIAQFYTAWTAAQGRAGVLGEIATWLGVGGFASEDFAAICAKHGVLNESWFRTGLLDLVLAYAVDRLAESPLTIDQVADMRLLIRALHIREGEFE